MRFYSDVIPDKGQHDAASAIEDAVITVIPAPGEYVKLNWISWSFADEVDDGHLILSEITNGTGVYFHIWINKKTTGGRFFDTHQFVDGGEEFVVGTSIEIRLIGLAEKFLAASYQ